MKGKTKSAGKGATPVTKGKEKSEETKSVKPETETEASETPATESETKGVVSETQPSAESVKSADAAGRRCRVLRSGALQGEVAIVAEEAGGRVRAKLCAPVFANDPGVWLAPDEYELL